MNADENTFDEDLQQPQEDSGDEETSLEERDAEAADEEQKRRDESKRAWRLKRRRICENLESLVIALILSVVIRQYVAEAYKIPTGSMQPTLMGDNDADEGYGDRIVVDKMYYHFHPVKRWDVLVFKFPQPTYISLAPGCARYNEEYELGPGKSLDSCARCHADEGVRVNVETSRKVVRSRRNYVKRCVALPGETIEIKHGDIYIDDAIPQRPERVQDALWFRYYFCDFEKENPFDYGWVTTPGTWRTENDSLTVTPQQGETARFSLPHVRDYIILEKNRILPNQGRAGSMLVGDIKHELNFTFDSPESALRIEIVEDNCTYTLVLSPDKNGCYVEWVLNDGQRPEDRRMQNIDVSLPPHREHGVAFANVDDTLLVKLDNPDYTSRSKFEKGQIELLYEDDDDNASRMAAASASIEVSSGPVTFRKMNIYRDIYYTDLPSADAGYGNGLRRPYPIPDGEYFAMGDNSANSSDSRSWGTFPRENIVGRAGFVFYPIGPIINWKMPRIIWTNRLKVVK
ncbi:MAG: signal peptidase I [Planctomycetota bacterium]